MQKRPDTDPGPLQRLPAVSRLLASRALAETIGRHGAGLVTDLLREHVEGIRRGILDGRLDGQRLAAAVRESAVVGAVKAAAEALAAPRPRLVINATGIVVHTNLGRSTLSAEAAREVAVSARGYLDLEYDLERGERGSRLTHLGPAMGRLFPGHAFTVVNNNAAAVMLCLRALAHGKEVPISRGELVEIGGSFRVPDILAAAGAHLREVGTTNRTRLADYEQALGTNTGLILKVHTSNFKMVGFTEETGVDELAELARRAGVPLVVDWGSGNLLELEALGIHDELPVGKLLSSGADLVTFSGDKLLGGPQAGFVVGREDLLERIKRDPLARVCRLDRLLIGALQRTLLAFARGRAWEEVPTLRMLALGVDELDRRARSLQDAVRRGLDELEPAPSVRLEVVDGISRTGGGSSPTGERPTRLLSIGFPGSDAGGLERALRAGEPPVVGRLHEGRMLFDPRTVLPEQEPVLVARIVDAIRGG